ncbi:ANTAR domain-containing protein [Cryobacterium melibiosiphilum]|uniref:ANTAR domain-containing protein n=1 Tax=Cryobacterium melibiosiphilum TaxID=995039 RepID=A0A3A5MFW4_9MICO|nr:ANTAR domain-containing protein [Cryobacterium melibiosiphilum]
MSLAPERGTSLCEPFLSALPIDRAAISTLGPPFARETLFATDATAARFDEIQLDLGEGPCWCAVRTRRPVLVWDILGGDGQGGDGQGGGIHAGPVRSEPSPGRELQWPTLREAVTTLDVAAVYAFPLMVGALTVGAVDLHTRVPGRLDDVQIVDAQILAGLAARHVLRRALDARKLDVAADDASGFSRRAVHQATGMVLAQMNSSAADALLMIHGHAFSSGRSVREIAADVVARRLDFSTLDES